MSRSRWLIIAVLLSLAWLAWSQRQALNAVVSSAPSVAAAKPEQQVYILDGGGNSMPPPPIPDHHLPPEALATLRLIADRGPFPHDRDGVVFGNYENHLPGKPRGYYHEYTVTTPGAHNRGARRIITGGEPPEVFYYTDDHYRSFRQIERP